MFPVRTAVIKMNSLRVESIFRNRSERKLHLLVCHLNFVKKKFNVKKAQNSQTLKIINNVQ